MAQSSNTSRSRLALGLLFTSLMAACSSRTQSPAPSGPPPVAAQPATKAPAQTAPPEKPATEAEDVANIAGITVIGIFPPTTQEERDQDDGGLSEGYAHMQFAVEDVGKCLAPRTVSLRSKITRSLNVHNGEHTKALTFGPDWGHSVAIVLVEPGRDPEVVYADHGGAGALGEEAPQAAWKYFGEEHCKRYEPDPVGETSTSPPKHRR